MNATDLENSRILIVDDTQENIQVLGSMLRKEKYEINVAQNGLKAIHIAEKVDPDLILLDIMMPEMDGYEACKRLKESPLTEDIPIIFLTARSETDDIVKGFYVGAADYITKPFIAAILLARVKTHLSLGNKTKELKALSHKDGLTLIANRRYFNDFLLEEWSKSFTLQKPLTLIMIDIDHFKEYNDIYGHLQGDDVLKLVAGAIACNIYKANGLAARYGGEEFAVILKDTTIENGLKKAESIRKEIEKLNIPHSSNGKTDNSENIVTASFGVATLIPKQDRFSEQLIQVADTNLYKAKEAGRNQVK